MGSQDGAGYNPCGYQRGQEYVVRGKREDRQGNIRPLQAAVQEGGNLDRAFERRFLFKIRFERPSVEAKRHIWLDKLPGLAEREAGFLASNFDFSGGEIDNIVRKAVMMEVLDGEVPSIEALVKLCGEEKIGSSRQRIGFGN